jgi:hypothetical protein
MRSSRSSKNLGSSLGLLVSNTGAARSWRKGIGIAVGGVVIVICGNGWVSKVGRSKGDGGGVGIDELVGVNEGVAKEDRVGVGSSDGVKSGDLRGVKSRCLCSLDGTSSKDKSEELA